MRTLNHADFMMLPACLVLSAASLASASDQTPPSSGEVRAAQQTQQGPLTVQPVSSGFIVAPDVKITNLNHATETLLGGYGGVLLDSTLLLGAGGYWLASGSRDRGMVYGGAVAGWFVPIGRTVRFGVRGLVGGGQARLSGQQTVMMPGGFEHFGRPGFGMDPDRTLGGAPYVRRVHYDQGFFVAEPQADVLVRVTGWMRFNAGIGYRAIAAARGAEDQLRGVTGSVALQFGKGF